MKKITYDPSVDAAYIYFQLLENMSGIVSQTHCCDPKEVWGMINIDFDKTGKIFWIELMPASLYLPYEILKEAKEKWKN